MSAIVLFRAHQNSTTTTGTSDHLSLSQLFSLSLSLSLSLFCRRLSANCYQMNPLFTCINETTDSSSTGYYFLWDESLTSSLKLLFDCAQFLSRELTQTKRWCTIHDLVWFFCGSIIIFQWIIKICTTNLHQFLQASLVLWVLIVSQLVTFNLSIDISRISSMLASCPYGVVT
jgi:hypothetical protein